MSNIFASKEPVPFWTARVAEAPSSEPSGFTKSDSAGVLEQVLAAKQSVDADRARRRSELGGAELGRADSDRIDPTA